MINPWKDGPLTKLKDDHLLKSCWTIVPFCNEKINYAFILSTCLSLITIWGVGKA